MKKILKLVAPTMCILLIACSSPSPEVCMSQKHVNLWNGFKWDKDPLILTYGIKSEDERWIPYIKEAVESWNNLGTAAFFVESSSNDFDIRIIQKETDEYLGLAVGWLNPDSGYIYKGQVTMSTAMLKGSYSDLAIQHVVCQELGHLLGLAHMKTDSCMDDCSWTETAEERSDCLNSPEKATPSLHDKEMILDLYGERMFEENEICIN